MAVVDYCLPLPDLQPLFGIAVALSFAVIAFLFMLGRILTRSDLEAIARKELNQTLIAVIIALAVVGLAGVSCEGIKAVMSDYAPGYNHFTYSYEYLNRLTNEIGKPAIQNLWTISYTLRNFPSELSFGKFKFDPVSTLFVWANVAERMAGLLFTPFIGSLHIQLLFLQFSQAFAITLILPIGMVLRAIPLTRTGGSFLIALAFGMYVVMPLMYVVDYEISKKTWPIFDTYLEYQREIPLQESTMVTWLSTILSPLQTISKILPQSTILAILNLTVFLSFVEVFTKFIDDIE